MQRVRWAATTVGVVFTTYVVLGMPSAGAHHPDHAPGDAIAAAPASLADSLVLSLRPLAVVLLVAALGLGLAWAFGPIRFRSQRIVRLALGVAAGSAVLAACASAGEVLTLGDDVEVTSLFTAEGGDALVDAVSEEAAAAGTGSGLPDLVGFTGKNFSTDEITFAGVTMLAYSFDGIVGNTGAGPLDIYGNPQLANPADPESHDVWQREWDGTSWRNIAKVPIRFEAADSHNHFHLMQLARYSLWDADLKVQIAPSHKVGFCFLDSQPLGFWSLGKAYEGAAQIGDASPRPYAATDRLDSFCRAGAPHAEALHMGVSPGWGDLYDRNLKLQWVDISDVPPGIYTLASEMDPNNVIAESDETNNGPIFAEETMAVWGYRAEPTVLRANGPVGVALTAASTGQGLPAPLFTITRGPTNGTIDAALGAEVPAGMVNYVPNDGFVGFDTIEFTARNPQSPYPLTPTKSVAMIVVGDPGVAPLGISGARDVIHGGGGMELTVVGDDTLDPMSVAWAVNGIPGGDASVGTITNDGHYQAPVGVGTVAISATLPNGPTAETTVQVILPPNHAPFIDEPVTHDGEGELVAPGDIRNLARRLSPLKVDEPVAILVPTVDLNGDLLTISATGLPPGLTISAGTGAISGAPTQAGTFQVAVFATDGIQEANRVFELIIED